jgi:hypothetical protein
MGVKHGLPILRRERPGMLSEDFTDVVKIHIVVVWVMTPCSLVGGYQRFGGT